MASSSADCSLAGRPVDLVGQHDVGEDRAPLDVEVLGRRAPDAGADEVGGHEVGGELDAGELAADDLRQRRHGERLGQPGDALDQAVAVGQQAQQHPLDEPVLADDDALDLEERVLEQRGVLGAGDGYGWAVRPASAAGWAARLRSQGSPRGSEVVGAGVVASVIRSARR